MHTDPGAGDGRRGRVGRGGGGGDIGRVTILAKAWWIVIIVSPFFVDGTQYAALISKSGLYFDVL